MSETEVPRGRLADGGHRAFPPGAQKSSMTQLAVSISGSSHHDVVRRVRAALAGGAGLIEFRLDLMADLDAIDFQTICAEIRESALVILTIRSVSEGGDFDGDDVAWMNLLEQYADFADIIDVEHSRWKRSSSARALVRNLVEPRASAGDRSSFRDGKGLLLSRHDKDGRPTTLQADFVALLEEASCDIPKIAWRSRTARDNFEALELTLASSRPAIVICMGDAGLLSRVLAQNSFLLWIAESNRFFK